MKNVLITVDDYERLLARMNYVPSTERLSIMERQLYLKLLSAETISQLKISKRVITMNSRVRLRESLTQKEIEVTITYPESANSRESKISILSPVGIALIGQQKGDQVSWKIPSGVGQFEIIEILYQPESVGEYSL
ncbi:MAG: GreA/GreB family elongation factor [Cyclobacteriaceae bacterium]|jgi:regulator of nucleoside diphosphate kinase|nr:GreA/GreB family elongation factor [Cyclobacteriaceae bacterium]